MQLPRARRPASTWFASTHLQHLAGNTTARSALGEAAARPHGARRAALAARTQLPGAGRQELGVVRECRPRAVRQRAQHRLVVAVVPQAGAARRDAGRARGAGQRRLQHRRGGRRAAHPALGAAALAGLCTTKAAERLMTITPWAEQRPLAERLKELPEQAATKQRMVIVCVECRALPGAWLVAQALRKSRAPLSTCVLPPNDGCPASASLLLLSAASVPG